VRPGNLAGAILEELERSGEVAAGELRDRLRSALEDYAVVISLALAGEDVEEAKRAAEARFAALEAAGLIVAAGALHNAVRTAVLGLIRGALGA